MAQDSKATELLQWIITTVHWLLIQHLPYIVHFFPPSVLLLAEKTSSPCLSHSVVKLIEIAYCFRSEKEYYVILRKRSSVC